MPCGRTRLRSARAEQKAWAVSVALPTHTLGPSRLRVRLGSRAIAYQALQKLITRGGPGAEATLNAQEWKVNAQEWKVNAPVFDAMYNWVVLCQSSCLLWQQLPMECRL